MDPWWSDAQAGWIGGIGGSIIGTLGGVVGTVGGYCVPKGKAKGFMYGSLACMLIVGVVSLIAFVVAVLLGQPYEVWYGLLMLGLVLTVTTSVVFPCVVKGYRRAELRRLEAEELRRS